MSDSAAIQLLDEAQVKRVLEDPRTRRFYYTFNKPGSAFLLVVSGLMLAGAAATWWQTGLITFWWFGLAALLALGALGLLAFIYTWAKFTDKHFLAMTHQHLYLGDEGNAWRIAWELLDAQALGFDAMDTNRLSGLMIVKVAGQQLPLRLYHPLVCVDDLQGFMVEVLTHLQSLQIEQGQWPELDDASDDAVDDAVDDSPAS